MALTSFRQTPQRQTRSLSSSATTCRTILRRPTRRSPCAAASSSSAPARNRHARTMTAHCPAASAASVGLLASRVLLQQQVAAPRAATTCSNRWCRPRQRPPRRAAAAAATMALALPPSCPPSRYLGTTLHALPKAHCTAAARRRLVGTVTLVLWRRSTYLATSLRKCMAAMIRPNLWASTGPGPFPLSAPCTVASIFKHPALMRSSTLSETACLAHGCLPHAL
mmetsp:Transcript_8258/g.24926  ORF Transcript_8258/g.24926 Transcript_8258/m.24926 type:complete len:224 (-) Transcript_8258:9343-10014(-)